MQTVRQAFTILKQNPLLSTISILGTAFAITMRLGHLLEGLLSP